VHIGSAENGADWDLAIGYIQVQFVSAPVLNLAFRR
jgi:hypothetical protein